MLSQGESFTRWLGCKQGCEQDAFMSLPPVSTKSLKNFECPHQSPPPPKILGRKAISNDKDDSPSRQKCILSVSAIVLISYVRPVHQRCRYGGGMD